MAPIAKRRRVLGPHARPLLWRPRTRFERGYLGRRAEGLGGSVVSEGTHFFFSLCFRFTDVCGSFTAYDLLTYSGLYWP